MGNIEAAKALTIELQPLLPINGLLGFPCGMHLDGF